MDTLAATWQRFAVVIAAAVDTLPGWTFHPYPPDATDPPAVWIDRGEQGITFDDPNLGEVTFTVAGAFANQPAAATVAAEIALIDTITAATASTAVNGLHRTALRTDPPGRLELGSVAYRAALIHVTVVYSLC